MRQPGGEMVERKRNIIAEMGMRGNVWRGLTASQENVCRELEHPAMMPEWLAGNLITSWSNPEDLILDPMCGSGTTLLMAAKLKRKFIGIELNPDYIKMAENRIAPEMAQLKMAL
jgi:DNA modification methylase